MILYIVPFFVTFFSALIFEVCKYQSNTKFLIWIAMYVYLTGLIGFRYMVGGDSYFYMLYFNDISTTNIFDISWDAEYQPLFTLLSSFSKVLYPSFTSFQLLHVFIINSCLFYFIGKNTKFRFSVLFLCLVMFYINFTVEILRESLAIMVFVCNYKSLENNKWIKYYFGVFIAMMFHLSAVFLIVLPFLKFLKLNRNYLLLLVIAFFALNQLNYLFTFFENIEKINKKVNDYSEASYGWKTTLLFFATKTLLPISLFFWAKTKYSILIRYEYLICLFGLLGVCSIFNTIIFTRFSNYLMVFYCVALAEVLIPFFRKKYMSANKFAVMFAFAVILITSSYASFYWPAGYYIKWVPYYSVFSNEAENDKFIDRDY
jgi:hypothetical protein